MPVSKKAVASVIELPYSLSVKYLLQYVSCYPTGGFCSTGWAIFWNTEIYFSVVSNDLGNSQMALLFRLNNRNKQIMFMKNQKNNPNNQKGNLGEQNSEKSMHNDSRLKGMTLSIMVKQQRVRTKIKVKWVKSPGKAVLLEMKVLVQIQHLIHETWTREDYHIQTLRCNRKTTRMTLIWTARWMVMMILRVIVERDRW
jgi:hypothetical protein